MKRKLSLKVMGYLFLFSLVSISIMRYCYYYLENPKRTIDIGKVLKLSGTNCKELEKVLEHYKDLKEYKKYNAARYLIENMPGHFGIEQVLQDTLGNIVDFDFSQYEAEEYSSLIDDLDSKGYSIIMRDKNYDLYHITGDFLIENIDLAFEVWQYPWCSHLNFQQFCEYILPYRCQSEPLSDYRKYFKNKYFWLKDSLKNKTDVIEAASILQRHLKEEVVYSSKIAGLYEGFLSPAMMQKVKVGACESLANYCVLAMRSCGIPITYDQILYWARSNSGHVYNSIIAKNEDEYLFSLPDAPPKLRTPKPATVKVWRHTYRNQHRRVLRNTLENDIPLLFLNQHSQDITEKYSSTSDLVFMDEDLKHVNMAYLCCFNYGEWKPVAWSKDIMQNKVKFENIAKGVLYSVMNYKNGFFEIVGSPFIFKGNNTVTHLNPDTSLNSSRIKIEVPAAALNDIFCSKQDSIFDIFYWEKGWIKTKCIVEMEEKIVTRQDGTMGRVRYYQVKVSNVPGNTLFWFGQSSRLYVIEDGTAQRY